MWKRKQYKLQFEWDTVDFAKNLETIRPEFELKVKKKRRNPVTGQVEPYLPLKDKLFKYLLSYSAVLFMVCLVLALLVAVIVYRIILNTVFSYTSVARFIGSTIVSITSAIINLIVILVLSQFYSWLSVKLTDLEYRRTDTEYENSLTIKMYCFQFVNFYGSLFYIAFFKGK